MILAIISKETRDVLREKHIRMAMAMGLVLSVIYTFIFVNAETVRELMRNIGEYGARAPIFVMAFVSFFASVMAVPVAIETFVGERERRTIEALLVTPLSTPMLFLGKTAAVLVLAIGYGLVLGPVALTIVWWRLHWAGVDLPLRPFLEAFVLALPLLVVLPGFFCGLGTVISSFSRTVKGAGQIFGVVMTVLIFGSVLVSMQLDPMKTWNFISKLKPWQIYAGALAAILALDFALLAVGTALFRRERLVS